MLTNLLSNLLMEARILGNIMLLAATLLPVMCLSTCAASPQAADLFISLEGSDGHAGSHQEPFRTLERARDRIRALKQAAQLPDGGLTVWLREGLYQRQQTFELTEQDSGSAGAPIVYCAYPGEQVQITGGRQITGFTPVTNSDILQYLSESARGNVLVANLPTQGITHFGHPVAVGSRPQVFFNNQPMTLARWPNEDWARTVKVTDAGLDENASHGGKFIYGGDEPDRWVGKTGVFLHGFWTHDWADDILCVQSIDAQKKEITLADRHGYGLDTRGYGERRYYALNILEELDCPGEWYLDRTTGQLYFWPPASVENATVTLSMREEPLISLNGASYITIQGLTIECCRSHAVTINKGSHNLIADCVVRNIGNRAVVLSTTTNSGVVACDIYSIGAGGIILDGGDRQSLQPGSNYAVNNHIWDYARRKLTYGPAVQLRGVGNRVAHNLIHDAPHNAILLSGNDHLIEFNEIHHVCQETGDVGAFYVGRDWTERGTVIRYNYFHHIAGYEDYSMAVYLDDCASGTTVFGNLFYQTRWAVFIGGGRDNIVENNIFVGCQVHPAVHIDARGLNRLSMVYETMKMRLEKVNYLQPPYSDRYPEIAQLTAYYQGEEGVPPGGNRIIRNVSVGGQWLGISGSVPEQATLIQDNLVTDDPGFVAPEQGNFQLKDDSPAYALGFQRIPLEQIGLCTDEYRSSLPN